MPNIKDLSLLQSIQTSSAACVRLVSGVKLPVDETHHSPPSSAEVKNEWLYASTPS
jgi:hypothetical protein